MLVRVLLCTGALALLLTASAVAESHRTTVGLSIEEHRETRDDEGSDEGPDEPQIFAEFFESDPLERADSVVAGQALDRLEWESDAPAYPGDVVGSLSANYNANAAAGLFGFHLPQAYDQDSEFTAAAAFLIRSDGFTADPNGFFQISWGLWNTATTGLERTGNFDDFAGDTFELIGFDYFPNVSPYFGGPFVSPGLFGLAAVDDASFEFSGSFVNFTGLFDLEVALPLDVPLLAVLEHRPDLDALVVQIYRIVDADNLLPLQGAVGSASLDLLALREYEVDAMGLTLWKDGFSGSPPSLTARLAYHALVVVPGLPGRPEELLGARPE